MMMTDCCVIVAASKVVWKRAIQGVREMCDACDATLFNVHWTCGKCGFAVCADCYRAKRAPPPSTAPRRDSVEWMTCSANRQIHEPDSLMSTQIVPSDGTSLQLLTVATNLENLEYSGISPNVENSGNSQGILCNLREKL